VRIGHGYDVHRFLPEDGVTSHVRLGGVDVPCRTPIEAHSDGDVLIHALCDALLGAAALGDIGRHFPDTEAAFENADSMDLLARVMELLSHAGWRIGNADLTLVAQTPRVAMFVDAMASRIAEALGVNTGAVNVKATTTERLDAIGAGEGLAAHAVVLLMASAS
jgi:2-C-methyl-D-erythritol 2,4-cyclodiphosphate synthase